MTTEALAERVAELADRVVSDPCWECHRDDLSVAVLGMLLDGFNLPDLDAVPRAGQAGWPRSGRSPGRIVQSMASPIPSR